MSTLPDHRVRLVLVTGSGRSGTSTVAGALKRLGLHIPQPEVPADESNPRGFYEPQWVVDFHKPLLNDIPVRTIDCRPRAAALAAKASNKPAVERTLRDWLSGQLDHDQLVIKDPRAFWVHDLWRKVAGELDIELSFLTMLRHPVDVAKSRDTAYLTERTDEFRRQRETANIAAWCNAAFETELATREGRRSFVRYTDLVSDWRPALARAGEQLGITFEADLSSREHHPVDDFIDTLLNRSQITWDDTDVPADLRANAERVWDAMNVLVDSPHDAAAIEELAQMRADYGRMYEYAEAIALDHTNSEIAIVRRNTTIRVQRQHREELAALRRQLAEATRQPAASRQPVASLPRRIVRKVRSLRR